MSPRSRDEVAQERVGRVKPAGVACAERHLETLAADEVRGVAPGELPLTRIPLKPRAGDEVVARGFDRPVQHWPLAKQCLVCDVDGRSFALRREQPGFHERLDDFPGGRVEPDRKSTRL